MEADAKVLMSGRQGPLLFELRRTWPCRGGVSQHCPACAERRRRADHKPGSANCALVNPRRDAQPPPSQSRGGGGTRVGESRRRWRPGDCPQITAGGRREYAGGAVGGASLGSSPQSPPGKRPCVERSPVEKPLPQREPRQRGGPSGVQSAPVVVEEAKMEDLRGWEEGKKA